MCPNIQSFGPSFPCPSIFVAHSWTRPSTGNVHPLGETTAFLALNVDDIGVAAAAAAHAILLGRVPVLPIVVLFNALALV